MEDYVREGCLNHISDIRGFDKVYNITCEDGHIINGVETPDGATNLFGTAHGGFLMTLCDITACQVGYSLGKFNMTLASSFNFLKSPRIGETITCEGTCVHNGKTTIVADVVIRNEDGALCVKSTFTLHVARVMTEDDPVPQPFFGRNDF